MCLADDANKQQTGHEQSGGIKHIPMVRWNYSFSAGSNDGNSAYSGNVLCVGPLTWRNMYKAAGCSVIWKDEWSATSIEESGAVGKQGGGRVYSWLLIIMLISQMESLTIGLHVI